VHATHSSTHLLPLHRSLGASAGCLKFNKKAPLIVKTKASDDERDCETDELLPPNVALFASYPFVASCAAFAATICVRCTTFLSV
jgi:hypothetical protein